MLEIHRLYCWRFLDQFESAQKKLLNLNQNESAHEFELLFNCFKRECQKNLSRLEVDKANKEQYRLFKQLDLICKHIKELTIPLQNLKANNFSPEQVIQYFEAQVRFKKVLNNHLRDLDNFLVSTTN
jgi:hypothetical protein